MKNREKLTPQSLESEQSTLGAMLMERDAIARASEVVQVDDFYREGHRKIFTIILGLFDRNEPVDLITTAEELRRAGLLEELGGSEYLSALIDECPSSANVEYYAKEVLRRSRLRKLLALCEEVEQKVYNFGYDGETEIDGIASHIETQLTSLADAGKDEACQPIGQIVYRVAAGIEEALQDRGRTPGISCGFPALDNITDGFHKGHLFVLGGRPAMGKSALAIQCAYNVAVQGLPVLYFSYEMTKDELTERLISILSEVDMRKVKRGYATDTEVGRIVDAAEHLRNVPLIIQDAPGTTTRDMRNRARRVQAEYGQLGLIVADYLQIIGESRDISKRQMNKSEVIGRFARECHTMAMEQDCTCLALSSLSRSVEQRDDKRPMPSDLKESGDIESEANKIVFIYRHGYYEAKKLGQRPNDVIDNKAECIVAKNRGGPTGTVPLLWTGQYTKFGTWIGGDDGEN